MSIFDDMDMASAQFTKTDRVVYETIRKFPDLFVQGSLAAIAEETHLSAPSLTRFAKRVGYKGFSEFQYQFRSDLEERDENQTGSKSDAYAELLRKVERDVPDALLCDLVRRMRDASTVVATGASLSRIPAYHLFVMTGALLGKGLYLNADELTSHIGSDCVLFVFSVNSGFVYRKMLSKIREQKCPPYVVLVTMNPRHTLAKHADQVVVLPRLLSGESLGVGTADSMAFLMFLELLSGHLES